MGSKPQGSVGVNCWGGMAFYFGLGWGAFPKHDAKDIQSGNGRLLEALCLQHIQKGVIQAPFANLLQPKLHERFVPQFFKVGSADYARTCTNSRCITTCYTCPGSCWVS